MKNPMAPRRNTREAAVVSRAMVRLGPGSKVGRIRDRRSTLAPLVIVVSVHLLALLVGAGAPAQETDYSEAIAAARELIEERLEALPGFSVAVAVDGEIVWAQGFGLADVESKKPVTTQTRFRIGSTSKPITSALAGRLLEQSTIRLDEDVRTLYPEFPDKGSVITLRHLLSNQAGIRHYKGAEFMNRRHYDALEKGIALFAEDELLFEPGTEFRYSSHGFNLAGVALERAGEADFPTLIEREIFAPLGMTSSGTDDVTLEIPERATFYNKGENGPRKAPLVDDSYKWPSGGLLSTPSDMVRFGSGFLAGGGSEPWLKEETIALLWSHQRVASSEPTGYALGWRVQARDEAVPESRYLVHHGGSSMGARSMLLVLPDHGVVVSTLCNSDAYQSKEKDAGMIADFFVRARAGLGVRRSASDDTPEGAPH